MSIREFIYQKKHFTQNMNITLHFKQKNAIYLQLIPTPSYFCHSKTFPLVLNETKITFLNLSFTILLCNLIYELDKKGFDEITEDTLDSVIESTLVEVKSVYPFTRSKEIAHDLFYMLHSIYDVMEGDCQ